MKIHASVVAFVLLALAASAPAGVTRVRVHVDGMACPFCAYNIEKRLKTLDGVARDAEFKVSVERGVAELAWTDGVAFDPDAVREQVRRAGFTPGGISITATGAIQWTEATEQLELGNAKAIQAIVIESDDRVDRQRSFNSLRSTAQSATSQRPLQAVISGEVKGEGSNWRIVLQRWVPVEHGAALIFNVKDLVCENCVRNVVEKVQVVAGVIHAEADFESDRVWVWTESKEPDFPGVDAIRKAIESAGFSVTHTHQSGEPPRK